MNIFKKLIPMCFLVVFILIVSFPPVLSTQYLLKEGESTVFNGKTVKLEGVSSDSVVVSIDNGVTKGTLSLYLGQIGAFNGLQIKVVDIYYNPIENGASYAVLDISAMPNSCSDSDGGFEPKIIGTVSGYYNGVFYSIKDKCTTNNLLNESYCVGTSWQVRSFNCNSYPGYICSLGKCIKSSGGGGGGGRNYLLDLMGVLREFINKIFRR